MSARTGEKEREGEKEGEKGVDKLGTRPRKVAAVYVAKERVGVAPRT